MNIHNDPLSDSFGRNGRDRAHSDDRQTQTWDPLLVAADPLDEEQLWMDLEQLVGSQLMSIRMIEADEDPKPSSPHPNQIAQSVQIAQRTPIAQIVHIPQSTQIAQIVQIAQSAHVVQVVQIAQSAQIVQIVQIAQSAQIVQIVQIAQIVRLAQCLLFLCHCDCQPKNPQGARSRVEPILTVSKFEYDNGICHPIVND